MAKSIYVGNLPWSATEEQVQNLFAEYGSVLSVKLVNDRETGRARGFAVVHKLHGEHTAILGEKILNLFFGGGPGKIAHINRFSHEKNLTQKKS